MVASQCSPALRDSRDLFDVGSAKGYFQVDEFTGYLLYVDNVIIIIQPVTDRRHSACADFRDFCRLNYHEMFIVFYGHSMAYKSSVVFG